MTPDSALRRGLGRGAYFATPDMVWSCVERDFRWDPSVDQREVYLARLVRDLGLPVGRVVDLLGVRRSTTRSAFWRRWGERATRMRSTG